MPTGCLRGSRSERESFTSRIVHYTRSGGLVGRIDDKPILTALGVVQVRFSDRKQVRWWIRAIYYMFVG